jgi:hypothetical protein
VIETGVSKVNVPNVTRYIHAYKSAPWRIEIQWAGSASLAVISFLMVGALYLSVSSGTAVAGREIQELNAAMIANQQINTDLQTELATLTSSSTMVDRALELGFRPVAPDEVEYLVVPGYFEPKPDILASAELPQMSAQTVPHEYNESLLNWLNERISVPARGTQ